MGLTVIDLSISARFWCYKQTFQAGKGRLNGAPCLVVKAEYIAFQCRLLWTSAFS